MKKLLPVLLAVYIITGGSCNPPLNAVGNLELFTYEPVEEIIITHPGEKDMITTSARISLLGACNPKFPLFINGKEAELTNNGFFTEYAELQFGENLFILENGENIIELIINREEPETGDLIQLRTEYFTIEHYGYAERDHISRFADLDDEGGMKTLLAKGTTFLIAAEHGDYFILEDNTAVFKDNVVQLDRLIPPIALSGGEINASAINYNVTDNPLYSVELNENKAIITFFAAHDNTTLESDGEFITAVKKSQLPDRIIHELEFVTPPLGYAVNFSGYEGGMMTINFTSPKPLKDTVVLLDAGHGGSDPGALGPPGEFGPQEKDFNLYVANVTREHLESLGVTVIFIREKDEHIGIFDRMDYFVLKPDIAVCVHANSLPITSDFSAAYGPLMFFTVDETYRAADAMIKLIAEETGNGYEPPRRRNFAMARYSGAPSMLFEMGFLCNPTEYERMLDTEYLNLLGKALGMAIEEQLSILNYQLSTVEIRRPPPESELVIEFIDDFQPVLIQGNTRNDTAVYKYIVFICLVLAFGCVMYLPSTFKKK